MTNLVMNEIMARMVMNAQGCTIHKLIIHKPTNFLINRHINCNNVINQLQQLLIKPIQLVTTEY